MEDVDWDNLPPSTAPAGLAISVKGFTNHDAAVALGKVVGETVMTLGSFMDLSTLVGVTIGVDYDAALASIDQGMGGLRPLDRTYDWVPDIPRGFVRDIRVRWALEEAGRPYRVESTPFRDRQPAHFARQPFGQVPWLADGDLVIFESGAILLHLGELSDKLMTADPRGRSEVKKWLFAALASVEAASQPWSFFKFSGNTDEASMWGFFDSFLNEHRLPHMETVLARREWLAGSFSVADFFMADVLRLVDQFDGLAEFPACRAYVARATARPAFAKAHADQMAHFTAAD